MAPNAGDVQQLIGHINTREKIRLFFFSTVLLRVFSGPEIPVYHRSLCDKKFYHSEYHSLSTNHAILLMGKFSRDERLEMVPRTITLSKHDFKGEHFSNFILRHGMSTAK